MFNSYSIGALDDAADWTSLREQLDPGVPGASEEIRRSEHLRGVLNAFRDVGASHYIHEQVYIDRDFVHAYASFYHRTHRPQPKHCSRIHFFRSDLTHLGKLDTHEIADALEQMGKDYLGFAVLRPVRHAPVSWALVSAEALMAGDDEEGPDVLIRANYEVHLLGAQLTVCGAPVNEQDSRTGSCAQSSIWSAARHLHKRYGEPWRSVVDITNAAVTHTDADIAMQLPHGSTMLSRDSMVRAMKNLGMHPLVYSREPSESWYEPAHRIVARYLDSGIPVIVGMEHKVADREEQHAVLAVGLKGQRAPQNLGGAGPSLGPTAYDSATHLLVNDDQAGPYKSLAILRPYVAQSGYEWCLEDATFIMPTLPDGVFMRPESAESIARNRVMMMVKNRDAYVALAEPDEGATAPKPVKASKGKKTPAPEPVEVPEDGESVSQELFIQEFDEACERLTCRTYLTPGWKYVRRMLRNDVPDFLKNALVGMAFSKFVYVTEFAIEAEIRTISPCDRLIRGHVTIDPTANPYDDPPVSHVPGLLMVTAQDTDQSPDQRERFLYILDEAKPYRPKVRGWQDYAGCPTA